MKTNITFLNIISWVTLLVGIFGSSTSLLFLIDTTRDNMAAAGFCFIGSSFLLGASTIGLSIQTKNYSV